MNKNIKDIKILMYIYILGNEKKYITYYADKAVLMAVNGNYLQRVLRQFLLGSQKYKTKISICKTRN
jgi:hypothetical protein